MVRRQGQACGPPVCYKTSITSTPRPALSLFLSEPARAAVDYGAMVAASTILLRAPRGDGHPVLVLPGFLAGDGSTATLGAFLRTRGHDVHGWRLGRNLGPTAATLRGMDECLDRLFDQGGRRVSIVGWSLGGIFARELARAQPDRVRHVITLGSPFRLTDSRHSRADAAFRRYSHLHVNPAALPRRRDLPRPIAAPSTALYSKLDGIVPWQSCTVDPGALQENVAVHSSHLGMGVNPAALWVIADRLAQTEEGWRPFRAPAMARRLFTLDLAAA